MRRDFAGEAKFRAQRAGEIRIEADALILSVDEAERRAIQADADPDDFFFRQGGRALRERRKQRQA